MTRSPLPPQRAKEQRTTEEMNEAWDKGMRARYLGNWKIRTGHTHTHSNPNPPTHTPLPTLFARDTAILVVWAFPRALIGLKGGVCPPTPGSGVARADREWWIEALPPCVQGKGEFLAVFAGVPRREVEEETPLSCCTEE